MGAKMKAKLAASLLWAGAALTGIARAEDGMDVKMSPLHFGALQEFGMIQKGLLATTGHEFSAEWIDHFGTFLLQEAEVNDRVTVRGGLGGIFEWPKEEKSGEEFGGSQYKLFYIGPSVAEAMYHFGGIREGHISFGGGMFPYKYNPDANNLGEYLFRSAPYPTFLITGGNGGLTAIGDQYAVVEGFHANAHYGNFTADVLLATETGLPPLYDWSLGVVAGYKIADGLIDLGAGVNFKRLFQIDAKKTAVQALENSYFQKNGVWYSGEARHYANPAAFLLTLADSTRAKGTHDDSVLADGYLAQSQALSAIATDSLGPTGTWINPATGKVDGAKYYTTAGTMVMARAAVDFKKLFDSEWFSPEDLRLYGEVAILGVENYPVYYEKITDRMPIMAGINIPTFRLLDLLSVQMEYLKNPNLNNTYTLGQKNWAIPYIPEAGAPAYSQKAYNDLAGKDDIAWSINARKRVLHSVTLSAQVARDHMHTISTELFYGSRFEPNEILHKNSSWYWTFQLGWNI
jgi:hypothetical protein